MLGKSVLEPSGTPSKSLSYLPLHEAVRSITTPPWMVTPSISSDLPDDCQHPFILLNGDKHGGSKVFCSIA